MTNNKKLYLIALGILILVSLLIVTYFFRSESKKVLNIIEQTDQNGWLKIANAELGIEFEYPSFLSVSFTKDRSDSDKKSVRLSRYVAYGERPGCNESGEPRPQNINYPEIDIEVLNQGWDEYVSEITREYNLTPDNLNEKFQKMSLGNSRTIYTEVVGWEGECNYLITHIPLDNKHLAVITEPTMFDRVNVVGEGSKTLQELTKGEPQLADMMRERILTSIRIIK